MRIQRGTGVPDPPPLKNHKNIGFLSNTGPDPLENHKATKTAFNIGPPSARQRNAISIHFNYGPLLEVFEFSSSSSTKKRCQSWTPLTNFLDPRMSNDNMVNYVPRYGRYTNTKIQQKANDISL